MDIIQCDGDGYRVDVLSTVPSKPNKEKIVVVQGGSDTVNRLAVSSSSTDILLDPHLGNRRDTVTQRDSGLNHVLCKLARENNVAIGFSFSSVLHTTDRVTLIGRTIQNIRLCRKYKVQIVIGTFAKGPWELRNIRDVQSFFMLLGMSGTDVKKDFVRERLDFKRRFVRKGVMLAEH